MYLVCAYDSITFGDPWLFTQTNKRAIILLLMSTYNTYENQLSLYRAYAVHIKKLVYYCTTVYMLAARKVLPL